MEYCDQSTDNCVHVQAVEDLFDKKALRRISQTSQMHSHVLRVHRKEQLYQPDKE